MKLLVAILFFFLWHTVHAQKYEPDTLTDEQRKAVSIAYRNSCFGQLILTDSCSRAGDSVGAGEHLMRVNPYYLMAEPLTPASIDSFITTHYRVPDVVRRRYTDSFSKVYNSPRSKAYQMFEKMYAEDQAIRHKLDSCTDSLSCSVASEQMLFTDSMHFVGLLGYVHRYGWPSIANGSIYASIIALHDHRHHKLYRPVVLQGTLDGIIERQILDLLYFWVKSEGLYITLSKHKYVVFDVTDVLKYKMPACLPEVKKVIAAHCPVNWYWNIEWEKNMSERDALVEFRLGFFGKILTASVQEMVQDNCFWDTHHHLTALEGLWSETWEFTGNDTSKMLLYLTYGDEIKYNDLDILFADSAFTTHAIYFDNNKADIKPESYVFLNELTQWLKSKPGIRIEISGHTDNVGSAPTNQKLSQDRANEVKKYLVAEGIDATRLSAKGFGDRQPMEPNTTEQGRAQNRRVELRKL